MEWPIERSAAGGSAFGAVAAGAPPASAVVERLGRTDHRNAQRSRSQEGGGPPGHDHPSNHVVVSKHRKYLPLAVSVPRRIPRPKI